MALRFIGFGAAKCATTWTYKVLVAHPAVLFPGRKELNFWSSPQKRGGLEGYREAMRDDDPSIAAGEISPNYTLMPVDKIRQMYAAYPDARLLFNVRHPVDRVWSRCRHLIHDAGLDLDSMSLPALGSFVFWPKEFYIGDYAEVLDRWLSVFPREQVLLSQFETFIRAPEPYFTSVARHLDIDPAPLLQSVARQRTKPRTPYRPMPDVYRRLMTEQFEEPMRRFRDRYGIDYTRAQG